MHRLLPHVLGDIGHGSTIGLEAVDLGPERLGECAVKTEIRANVVKHALAIESMGQIGDQGLFGWPERTGVVGENRVFVPERQRERAAPEHTSSDIGRTEPRAIKSNASNL